ncbi:hypothetical protein MMC13_000450 [Lambiella insularis]|nr:hypothetical protein [Lambiella insularis]
MAPNISTRRISCSRSSISSISSTPSDSTSRHSFQALLESPPPSPGLPSLLPHHGKKPSSHRFRYTSRHLKVVLGFLGLSITAWLFLAFWSTSNARFDVSYLSYSGQVGKLVNVLPNEPMPVAVTDHRGRTKWTVYIPQDEDFPLQPSVYASLCSQSEDLAAHLSEAAGHSRFHVQGDRSGYYRVDRNFLDVQEAEEYGLIPETKPISESWGWKSAAEKVNNIYLGQDADRKDVKIEDKVCERSLTYVMETADAGFGNTIMGMWMAYGLAQKEQRSFFIDDRNWAYGRYTSFFQPPTAPSCRPPPDNHRLPCPLHARHLLVSSSTFAWTFGHDFNENFKDTRKAGVLQQKDVFALLRIGYEALFHLADPDAEYLEKRRSDLDAKVRGNDGLLVGIHVRHGDRRPWEYQYQQSYLPLAKYADAARSLISETSTAKNGSIDAAISTASKIVLASDDPEVYTAPTFSSTVRAQEQILLASKAAFPPARQPLGAIHKFVDENTGWEGGFFKDVFWGLGTPSTAATRLQAQSMSTETLRDEPPSELALQLRGLLGRSYLLDLAVVGQADRVVCGVSSVACRLLAVMMGWEKGIVQGGWVNVDGGYEWVGIA